MLPICSDFVLWSILALWQTSYHQEKQQGRFLTKLEVIPGKLPFLIVWQLSGINKDVVIPFTGLNDLPPHLVLRFLQGRDSSQSLLLEPCVTLLSKCSDSHPAVTLRRLGFNSTKYILLQVRCSVWTVWSKQSPSQSSPMREGGLLAPVTVAMTWHSKAGTMSHWSVAKQCPDGARGSCPHCASFLSTLGS